MRGFRPFEVQRFRLGFGLLCLVTPLSPLSLRAAEGTPVAAPPPTPPPYVETITVTATSSPTPVEDIAGTVGRVDRAEIERSGARDLRDLTRFEPGVEVAGDPTRLGLGGLVIRGIGGNRVQTRVDGVPVAEDFAFGPLAITRFSIDPEALQSVEFVRSAASSLYGSDALGGVVALTTRDPRDLLRGGRSALGFKTGFDSRNDGANWSAFGALGGEAWRASLVLQGLDAGELDNQGDHRTLGSARTAPNPADHESLGGFAKIEFAPSERLSTKLTLETFRNRTVTEVYSARTLQNLGAAFGPGVTFTIDTQDFDADDEQERQRLSLEVLLQTSAWFADSVFLRAYGAANETRQDVEERVVTTRGGGFLGPIRRSDLQRLGVFDVEQDLLGLELQAKRGFAAGSANHLLTYGVAVERDSFDMLRDRREFDAATGLATPPTVLVPTKYFPRSDVDTLGAYVQSEIDLAAGRLRLIPGVRYDRSRLEPTADDAVFLAGNPGTPAPTAATADALSPKLGLVAEAGRGVSLFAQYSRGFRTPPYSSVNNGFTNTAGGYRTLPNPDLEPETSDNYELGARVSGTRGGASLTVFDNAYEDFIEQVGLGVNPANGLSEFQYQNLTAVRVRGVELAGDRRLGTAWHLRGAAAWVEGENRATDRPLNSVSPPKAVLGFDWTPAASRWSAGAAVTHLLEKRASDIDRSAVNQFATPDATLVDLFAELRLGRDWVVQGTITNLLDETWWNWGDVGGVASTSRVLERYSAPGRAAAFTLRYQPGGGR